MVGGTVIETIDAGNRVWINCRDDHYSGDLCAICVERNIDALVVCVGDVVWWHGKNAYWTPQGSMKGFGDIAIPRIGYSGARRPMINGDAKCDDCSDDRCTDAGEYYGALLADMAAEEDAYIAKGVCSDCGACSLKEASGKCRPRALGDTGDVTCAGDKLWRDEEDGQPTDESSDITPKTEPWEIESPQVSHVHGEWTIKCGGFQMPEYTITQPDIEDAIFELVKAVTRDAIEDEAKAWMNDKNNATEPNSTNTNSDGSGLLGKLGWFRDAGKRICIAEVKEVNVECPWASNMLLVFYERWGEHDGHNGYINPEDFHPFC